jgi:hypothetical protein
VTPLPQTGRQAIEVGNTVTFGAVAAALTAHLMLSLRSIAAKFS